MSGEQPSLDETLSLGCRICHQSCGRLLVVCQCSGSLAYVHSACISEWILCLLRRKPLAVPCCQLCGAAFHADITALPAQLCYWTLLRKFCQLGCKEMLLTVVYLLCFILAILFGWQGLVLVARLILYGFPKQSDSFLQLCNAGLRTILAKVLYPLYFLQATFHHLRKHRSIWRRSRKPAWKIELRPLHVRP